MINVTCIEIWICFRSRTARAVRGGENNPEGVPLVQGQAATGAGQREGCRRGDPELLPEVQAVRLLQANDARRHGHPERI